jgi:2-keto-4-pentenoate hydratase/2-oxohepta-3-ene-1,7-dioic acid hydratase in catechol pathway
MTRRNWLAAAAAASPLAMQAQGAVISYVRFRKAGATAYGILEGETIREISGPLFGDHKPNGKSHKLSEVKLLYPVQPTKVLALARNYRSHLSTAPEPTRPEIFYKPLTSLQNPGDPIIYPADATDLHFECELVLVIGKRASHITKEQAPGVIWGVTAGNDVSERQWQGGKDKDIQWWRAKGADTFGPMGPAVARGLNYSKLKIATRLNGKTLQEDSTAQLIFDCPTIVSFVSRYVTLEPGDCIYTGTPGRTSPMKPGDLVEVDLEGVGVLRNPVVAAKA